MRKDSFRQPVLFRHRDRSDSPKGSDSHFLVLSLWTAQLHPVVGELTLGLPRAVTGPVYEVKPPVVSKKGQEGRKETEDGSSPPATVLSNHLHPPPSTPHPPPLKNSVLDRVSEVGRLPTEPTKFPLF